MTEARWTGMVGAYVLDALEGEELAAFEARLAEDAELRRLVDEARASTLMLAESLPDFQPPEDLRDRVLARMRASKETGGLGAGGSDPGAAGSPGDSKPRPDIGPGGRTGGPGRSSARDDGAAGDGEGRGGLRSTAPWLLLAASVAGLLWLGNENRQLVEETATLEEETATLEAQLASVRASLGDAQLALARFDSMAAALTGPNVQFASLTGDTEPSLRLVWNRDRDLLLVAAQNLPPLRQNRTFQLWGIRGGEAPVSLGTFESGPEGDALVTLQAEAAEDYDVSAITEEPAGGSPQPTSTPFLVGAWNSAQ